MAGDFRSTLLPAIGPAVAQLPARSQISRVPVPASGVSAPAATEVVRTKDASAGLASPLPASPAVQAIDTLPGCHAPSGAAHVMAGAIESRGGLSPLMPASTHCWMACGRF